MPLNLAAIPLLSAFFRAPFLECAVGGTHTAQLRRTVKDLGIEDRDYLARPLKLVLNDFYHLLAKHRRCEYVYKNKIINELFFANHSLATAYAASEFRCGKSRADVAIFNGTSSVYEIKTDLDSLEKLPSQIADYRKVFDQITIVGATRFSSRLRKSLPADIGLIVVNEHMELRTIRKPVSNAARVVPAAIFDCLRRAEYLNILRQEQGVELSSCPNSEIYKKALARFRSFDSLEAHYLFVETLRNRRHASKLGQLLRSVPKSLRQVCMTLGDDSPTFIDCVHSALNSVANQTRRQHNELLPYPSHKGKRAASSS